MEFHSRTGEIGQVGYALPDLDHTGDVRAAAVQAQCGQIGQVGDALPGLIYGDELRAMFEVEAQMRKGMELGKALPDLNYAGNCRMAKV